MRLHSNGPILDDEITEENRMNNRLQIIHCSSNRCDSCKNQTDSMCQELVARIDEASETIILVEKQRGLLHVTNREENNTIEPPWSSDNWESIFIGPNNDLFMDLNDLIEIYTVGPYVCLFFEDGDKQHTRYEYLPLVRTSLELSLLDQLINESKNIIKKTTNSRRIANQFLREIISDVSNYIENQIPEINNITKKRLAQIVAHKSNILGPLFPILLDEMTEEVYLDGPKTNVYFDHQKLGRCITSVSYSDSEIPRIITFIRYQSNLHLDRGNPSLKMDLNLFDINLRLSASIPPLSVDGLHLEIRRARKKPYLIPDLIENGTMTYEAASLLVLAVACRFNITITGGPGTGKTTILNAFDMITPNWWRKVYIEDAVESRLIQDNHQVRFQVDPVDEKLTKLNKSEEIIKCLHRSPDYVILGEIQTEEHSKALFQAIAAGLHSMQTCHSDSAASLISRWIINHNIERTSLGLMDLIVTLERPKPGESNRFIKEIVEIRKGVQNGVLTFLGTNTVYDRKSNALHKWADDGAFLTHAKNNGIDHPEHVIDSLMQAMRSNHEEDHFRRLVEKLWDYEHPMQYIGN